MYVAVVKAVVCMEVVSVSAKNDYCMGAHPVYCTFELARVEPNLTMMQCA